MAERKQCATSVGQSNGARTAWYACEKPATVSREGKDYCATHDPERV